MKEELKNNLRLWASVYETKEFIKDDPIRFPHEVANRGGSREDIEISAILSSWLAYGNREQFGLILYALHKLMDYKPYDYLISQNWRIFKDSKDRMYRFYTYHDFFELMERLHALYRRDAFDYTSRVTKYYPLGYLIVCFQRIKGFPNNSFSACKRLNMLLRWMARKNSPVDLGLWDIDPAKLIIPVDTHVHRMALELGLTKRKQADMRTAIEITEAMREIWPDDPTRGDFALFGYGIEHSKSYNHGK